VFHGHTRAGGGAIGVRGKRREKKARAFFISSPLATGRRR